MSEVKEVSVEEGQVVRIRHIGRPWEEAIDFCVTRKGLRARTRLIGQKLVVRHGSRSGVYLENTGKEAE